MKNTILKICNESIHPGEQLSLALPLPEIFTCAPLYMPIKIIHGHHAGPTLLITAALYGNELNGTEIINRIMNLVHPKRLNGSIIAVPVLNVYGLINRSRYAFGGFDLDTYFPGSASGNSASRTTHIFTKEILSLANYCIDLRTGFMNHSNLPHAYINFQNQKSKLLAEAFNTPVILNQTDKIGSFSLLCKQLDIPFMIYESGEAMRFDDYSIKSGVNGILQVMKNINMLSDTSKRKFKTQKSYFVKESTWIRASASGISHSKHKLGQYVTKNEALCIIKDPFGTSEMITIHSPADGIIIGKNNLPLVQEGETLFQLAIFQEMQQAVDDFETWGKREDT